MSLSSDLLEQAEHLLKRERQRPRQASKTVRFKFLLRPISSPYRGDHDSYMAKYDARCNPADSALVRSWRDETRLWHVLTARSPQTAHHNSWAPVSNDMQLIAQSFIQLQEARHDADYDQAATWTRLTAQQYAQMARNAFAAWLRVRKSHEANVFALALLSAKLFDKER